MQTQYDVVIIGAGPSGMACSVSLSNKHSVLVLDEQPCPGGQLYRQLENQSPEAMKVLGKDYAQGASLIRKFRNCDVTYQPEAIVWRISADGRVCFSYNGTSHEVHGKRIVIATGAMERPVPFPGWTLPGVMTAGGADALFKTSGVLPTGPVCMVGSGPLLLLVAQHLSKAGIQIEHFFDTTSTGALTSALTRLPQALRRPLYLVKGATMLYSTMKTVGTMHKGITSYAVEGTGQVDSIIASCKKKQFSTSAKTVLMHEGIISRTEFSRQLNLAHSWDSVQRYWHPSVDAFGRTSNPAIFMIGDGAYVHGGIAAKLKGELAALALQQDLGTISLEEAETAASSLRKTLQIECSPRPFVDRLYRPRKSLYSIPDETLVCRCEEVTALDIRSAIDSNKTTPEMVKAITRCGMGPCQGRMCTIALNEIVASETGRPIESITAPKVRPPVRNLPLGELATMSLQPTHSEREGA